MKIPSIGAIAIAGAFALMIPAAPASAQPSCGPGHPCAGGRVPGAGPMQYRDHTRGFARDDRRGAAIGAGIAGLAAGAVIGGALQQNQGYYNYDSAESYPVYSDPGPTVVYSDPDPGYDAAPQVADEGDSVAYCQQTYRSYDPTSGTYLGYDGLRHPCP